MSLAVAPELVVPDTEVGAGKLWPGARTPKAWPLGTLEKDMGPQRLEGLGLNLMSPSDVTRFPTA